MKTPKQILEGYNIYNAKGELVPLISSSLGKSLLSELNKNKRTHTKGKSSIISVFEDHVKWSKKTFSLKDPYESIKKLQTELVEAFTSFIEGDSKSKIAEEYSDCLMCVLNAANSAGVNPEQLVRAFEKKLAKNKKRAWVKQPNGTFQHKQ